MKWTLKLSPCITYDHHFILHFGSVTPAGLNMSSLFDRAWPTSTDQEPDLLSSLAETFDILAIAKWQLQGAEDQNGHQVSCKKAHWSHAVTGPGTCVLCFQHFRSWSTSFKGLKPCYRLQQELALATESLFATIHVLLDCINGPGWLSDNHAANDAALGINACMHLDM